MALNKNGVKPFLKYQPLYGKNIGRNIEVRQRRLKMSGTTYHRIYLQFSIRHLGAVGKATLNRKN